MTTPSWQKDADDFKRMLTEDTEEIEELEDTEDFLPVEPLLSPLSLQSLPTLPSTFLRNFAVQHIRRIRTVTKPKNQKPDLLRFDFARFLKGNPETSNLTLHELDEIGTIWFELIHESREGEEDLSDRLGGEDLEFTLNNLAQAYEKVKMPFGASGFADAVERGLHAEPPPCTEGLRPRAVRLACICRELAMLHKQDGGRFFLTYEMVGEILGVSKQAASGLFHRLRKNGIIKKSPRKKGDGLAFRYLYTGDDA